MHLAVIKSAKFTPYDTPEKDFFWGGGGILSSAAKSCIIDKNTYLVIQEYLMVMINKDNC